MLFQVGHVGDDTMNSFTSPSVTWLKDGVPISTTPTNTDPGNNGSLESVLTFMFSSSDAGVYQCIFTDTVRSEVFLPHPIRLDTGKLLTPYPHNISTTFSGENPTGEPVSPTSIVLVPPEKLVLEIRTSGRFWFIQWLRNADPLFLFNNAPNFVHFGEVFYDDETTMDDLGLFETVVEPAPNSGQPIRRVDFTIVSPGKAVLSTRCCDFCVFAYS